jgi:PAS domain-containing protein
LILSSIVLWFPTPAVLAWARSCSSWKRRQERAVNEFSKQVWQLAREAGPAARMGIEGKNQVRWASSAPRSTPAGKPEKRGARLQDREQLFQRLVETVHDAVLVHRESDPVRQLALPVAAQLERRGCGRPAADRLRRAGICRVGGKQLRRRLAGESAAERYEIELIGAKAQVTRVELSSTVIDSAGEAGAAAHRAGNAAGRHPDRSLAKPRAMVTLDAMGESVITVDAEGRIDYINHSAETAPRPALRSGDGQVLRGSRLLGR